MKCGTSLKSQLPSVKTHGIYSCYKAEWNSIVENARARNIKENLTIQSKLFGSYYLGQLSSNKQRGETNNETDPKKVAQNLNQLLCSKSEEKFKERKSTCPLASKSVTSHYLTSAKNEFLKSRPEQTFHKERLWDYRVHHFSYQDFKSKRLPTHLFQDRICNTDDLQNKENRTKKISSSSDDVRIKDDANRKNHNLNDQRFYIPIDKRSKLKDEQRENQFKQLLNHSSPGSEAAPSRKTSQESYVKYDSGRQQPKTKTDSQKTSQKPTPASSSSSDKELFGRKSQQSVHKRETKKGPRKLEVIKLPPIKSDSMSDSESISEHDSVSPPLKQPVEPKRDLPRKKESIQNKKESIPVDKDRSQAKDSNSELESRKNSGKSYSVNNSLKVMNTDNEPTLRETNATDSNEENREPESKNSSDQTAETELIRRKSTNISSRTTPGPLLGDDGCFPDF